MTCAVTCFGARRRVTSMFADLPTPRLGDRALFPSLEATAYLNHAAISPPSLVVQHAVQEVLGSYASQGMHAFRRWIDDREVLRHKLGQLLGVHSGDADIGFVPNTTTAVMTVALCFPWSAGDGVVTFDGEFPANVTSWQRAAEVFDLQVHRLSLAPLEAPGGADLGPLEAVLVSGGVKLVAISSVQFQTGFAAPLGDIAALCHRHGAQLFVDGIQSVGVVPVDVRALGIDYLGCGSHKWLMSTEGCAFLYAAPGRAKELRPVTAGWLSHAPDGLRFLFDGAGHLSYDRGFKSDMSFTEGGAPNTVGFAALHGAVNTLASLGISRIFEHVTGYIDLLEPKLVSRGFTSRRHAESSRRSGTLSVRLPSHLDLGRMSAFLNREGIAVSTPDGHLRFAPHWPNEASREIAAIEDVIDAAMVSPEVQQ